MCGPPVTSMNRTSLIKSGRRRPVESIGRMRSSFPCATSIGTLILGRSRRKSVSQVRTQASVAVAEALAATVKVAGHLTGAHRETDQDHVKQV